MRLHHFDFCLWHYQFWSCTSCCTRRVSPPDICQRWNVVDSRTIPRSAFPFYGIIAWVQKPELEFWLFRSSWLRFFPRSGNRFLCVSWQIRLVSQPLTSKLLPKPHPESCLYGCRRWCSRSNPLNFWTTWNPSRTVWNSFWISSTCEFGICLDRSNFGFTTTKFHHCIRYFGFRSCLLSCLTESSFWKLGIVAGIKLLCIHIELAAVVFGRIRDWWQDCEGWDFRRNLCGLTHETFW